MPTPPTDQDYLDAGYDLDTIEAIVNAAADVPNPGQDPGTVTTRLGRVIKTLAKVIADLSGTDIEGPLAAALSERIDEIDMRGIVGAGTVDEREAYTYRNGGTPDVPENAAWLRKDPGTGFRIDVWVSAGNANPYGDGSVATTTGWKGLKSQREQDNLGDGSKWNTLPVENQEAMVTALSNIGGLYQPRIYGLRASALSTASPLRAILEWDGEADGFDLSWGDFTLRIGGGIRRIDTEAFDYDAERPLLFTSDSMLDGTWAASAAAELDRDAVVVAKYSSGAKQDYRLGVRKLFCTATSNTIPASGVSVAVTSINGVAPSASAVGGNPSSFDQFAPHGFLNTASGDTISTHCSEAGTWGGRHGVMSVPNGGTPAYSFVADDGLGATTVDPQTLFVPDNFARLKTHEITARLSQNYAFVGPGNPVFPNDINPRLLESLQLIADETVGQPMTVLGLSPQNDFTTGTPFYTALRYLNGTQANGYTDGQFYQLFGDRYAIVTVGGQKYNNSDYVRWFGRDGSANDQADYDAGINPRSVMETTNPGDVHYNAKGEGLEKAFWLLWRQQRKRPPALTLQTLFKMWGFRTQPAIFPEEPVVWTSEPVTAGIALNPILASDIEQTDDASFVTSGQLANVDLLRLISDAPVEDDNSEPDFGIPVLLAFAEEVAKVARSVILLDGGFGGKTFAHLFAEAPQDDSAAPYWGLELGDGKWPLQADQEFRFFLKLQDRAKALIGDSFGVGLKSLWRGPAATDIVVGETLSEGVVTDTALALKWKGRVRQRRAGLLTTSMSVAPVVIGQHGFGQSNSLASGDDPTTTPFPSGSAFLPYQGFKLNAALSNVDGASSSADGGLSDLTTVTDVIPCADSGTQVTPHTAIMIASELQARMRGETVHCPMIGRSSGRGAQPLSSFLKGTNLYTNLINSITKANGIAASYGADYLPFVNFTQGEDGGTSYQANFTQMVDDITADVTTAIGRVPIILTQQTIGPQNGAGDLSTAPLAQLAVTRLRKGSNLIQAGPRYQYPVCPDGIHANRLGRLYEADTIAHIQNTIRKTGTWLDLDFVRATRVGNVVTLEVSRPMWLDTDWVPATPNYGLAYSSTTITNVQVVNGTNTVIITLASAVAGTLTNALTANVVAGWSAYRSQLYFQTGVQSAFNRLGYAIPRGVRIYLNRFSEAVA